MVTETSTQTRRVPSWRLSDFDNDDEDDGYNYAKTNLYTPSSYTQTSIDEDEDDNDTAFEVEKNYNTTNYDDEEEETKPEFVMARKGLLEVDRPYKAELATQTKTKVQLSARMKIALTVYSLVIALIVGFAIYNAVAISNLNGTINATAYEISQSQEVINGLETEYNELGTSATIEGKVPDSFVQIEEGVNSFSKTAPILDAEETIEVESNWFDKICEFFSSLF